MLWPTLGTALLIFFLRVTDVTMGTIRMTMVMRGQRKYAAVIGFFEVTVWVLAISKVIANLDTVWNVIAYSGGFATGTMLGMVIENRLAIGYSGIHAISMTKGAEVATVIRDAGYGATQMRAEGQSGPVYLIDVIVPRKEVQNVLRLINEVDATTFVTVEDTRQVLRGFYRIVK